MYIQWLLHLSAHLIFGPWITSASWVLNRENTVLTIVSGTPITSVASFPSPSLVERAPVQPPSSGGPRRSWAEVCGHADLRDPPRHPAIPPWRHPGGPWAFVSRATVRPPWWGWGVGSAMSSLSAVSARTSCPATPSSWARWVSGCPTWRTSSSFTGTIAPPSSSCVSQHQRGLG